jgi:N-acetylglutamate synthase-like GNAT family acetyltransferase
MPPVRTYSSNDKEACLKIFDSNVPSGYVSAHERTEYESFLDHLPGLYLVVEYENEIVACGGFAPHKSESGTATLCWGMVTQKRHRSGIGRVLLIERLNRLSEDTSARVVIANTSQYSCGFFARMGFATARVVQDGICQGIDLHEMRLPMTRNPL